MSKGLPMVLCSFVILFLLDVVEKLLSINITELRVGHTGDIWN